MKITIKRIKSFSFNNRILNTMYFHMDYKLQELHKLKWNHKLGHHKFKHHKLEHHMLKRHMLGHHKQKSILLFLGDLQHFLHLKHLKVIISLELV